MDSKCALGLIFTNTSQNVKFVKLKNKQYSDVLICKQIVHVAITHLNICT